MADIIISNDLAVRETYVVTATAAVTQLSTSKIYDSTDKRWAKGVIIQILDNDVRFAWVDNPTSDASTSGTTKLGLELSAGDVLRISGRANLSSLKFINAASASVGRLSIMTLF